MQIDILDWFFVSAIATMVLYNHGPFSTSMTEEQFLPTLKGSGFIMQLESEIHSKWL